MQRIFLALGMGSPISNDLHAAALRFRDGFGRNGRISPVKAENIHVTLRFLGEIPENMVSEIAENLKPLDSFAPMKFNLSSGLAFPSPARPRILCMKLSEEVVGTAEEQENDSGVLPLLKSRVDGVLEDLGIEREEREFLPHMTLARVRQNPKGVDLADEWSTFSEKFLKKRDPSVTMDRLDMVESVLSSSGPVYSIVESFRFNR